MSATVNKKYILYRRQNGIYYGEDVTTGTQFSLRTRDKEKAQLLIMARNEGERDAHISRQVGMAYLACADPEAKNRDWQWVMDQILQGHAGETLRRWKVATLDKALNLIRRMKLVDTRAEHFLAAMHQGKVSTNVYLRRIHNFAMDMGWLPRPIIVRRQWPKVKHRKKRAITLEEHVRIVAREGNIERRDFYELLWLTGASQGDLSRLGADDIDWRDCTLRFFRAKTGSVVFQKFGPKTAALLRRLPAKGPLFPYLCTLRPGDRATEFAQRCEGLGIKGVSLHSYRYSWAQRAKKAGFPGRYAQIALGHNSKAIHEHYAGVEECEIPSLEDYESRNRATGAKQLPGGTDRVHLN